MYFGYTNDRFHKVSFEVILVDINIEYGRPSSFQSIYFSPSACDSKNKIIN